MGGNADAWDRIYAAAAEHDPKNTLTWLAGKLGYSIQRVQNWSVRGVPAREYPAIAEVFGESIEWVAGLAERKGRQPTPLDDDATAFAMQYQRMQPHQKELLRRLYMAAVVAGPPQVKPEDFLGGLDTSFGDLPATGHDEK